MVTLQWLEIVQLIFWKKNVTLKQIKKYCINVCLEDLQVRIYRYLNDIDWIEWKTLVWQSDETISKAISAILYSYNSFNYSLE